MIASFDDIVAAWRADPPGLARQLMPQVRSISQGDRVLVRLASLAGDGDLSRDLSQLADLLDVLAEAADPVEVVLAASRAAPDPEERERLLRLALGLAFGAPDPEPRAKALLSVALVAIQEPIRSDTLQLCLAYCRELIEAGAISGPLAVTIRALLMQLRGTPTSCELASEPSSASRRARCPRSTTTRSPAFARSSSGTMIARGLCACSSRRSMCTRTSRPRSRSPRWIGS